VGGLRLGDQGGGRRRGDHTDRHAAELAAPTTDAEALAVKRKAADRQCSVDVGFWGGAVPGNLAELPALHGAGVFGFKCFLLPSGVDEFPPLSRPELAAALPRPPHCGR